MFNKIYGFMKYLGLTIAIAAVGLYIRNGVYNNLGYSVLMLVLIVLILLTGVADILSKLRRITFIKEQNSALIIGHISMMLGVSAMIASLMSSRNYELSSALSIIAILIVFMIIMLYILLRIFNTLTALVDSANDNKETESETDNIDE